MIVHIVLHGERGVGGSVVGVYGSHKLAKEYALAQRCCFEGGWVPDGENVWRNGCDFVLIDSRELLR